MRRFTKLISAVLMLVIVATTLLCFPMNTMALTDGDWKFTLLDNEVTVTGYIGEGGDVVIPKAIYGCPVTKVHMDNSLGKATSVTFPETVTEFSGIAAYSNTLKRVILNDAIKKIPQRAFEHCTALEYVKLPSEVETIGQYAFWGCTALEGVEFPATLKILGKGAYESSGVTSVNFTGANPKMDEFVFLGCKRLKKVDLGTALTKTYGYMFSGCGAIEEVIMPNTLTNIAANSFNGCASLKQIVFPTSLKRIEFYAFSGCGFEEVVIPYGVTWVDNAFNNCPNLRAIFVPDTVGASPVFTTGSDNAIVYCTADSMTALVCKNRGISYLTDISVNSGVTVIYNGKRISFHSYAQNPEILEGRTLVPLRSIFEAMGADVEWDANTRTATAKRKDITVKIQIGVNEIYKNGEAIRIDVPAQIINDRTMVPVRVISEAFGAKVEWNGNGRTVFITE